MDNFIIAIVASFVVLIMSLTILGQRSGWGVTPLGILGFGFLVPFGMLLGGIL